MRTRTLTFAVSLVALTAAGWITLGGGRAESEPIEAARALAVTATTLQREDQYDRVQRFVGRVEFAQGSELSFELGGQVARLRVDEGDRVEEGARLAELDVARLRARRAEAVAARDEARRRP